MKKMDLQLQRQLARKDVVAMANWMGKQPRRQLYRNLLISQVTMYGCPFPRIFAPIEFLQVQTKECADKLRYILEIYIRAGCDINEVCDDLPPSCHTRKGFTPLLLAIDKRKPLAAKVLIDLGANVNQEQVHEDSETLGAGYSPLHWAVLTTTNTDLIKWLFEAGAKIGDSKKKYRDGVPPVLHVAVDEGRVEIVSYLLSRGEDVNTTSKYKVLKEQHWRELKSRYDCGHLEAMCHIMEISAVGRAVRMRKLDVLRLLLRNPNATVTLADLNYCILEGDSTTANIILGRIDKSILSNDKIEGTDISILHGLGKRAFQQKETQETIELIKTFVDSKLDINIVHDDTTILANVVKIAPGNVDLIKFLLHQGADPFLPLTKNAVQLSLDRSELHLIKLVVDQGFDLTRKVEFDMLLSHPFPDKCKGYQLEIVKTCFGNAQTNLAAELEYLFLAMDGENELIVAEILQQIPNDEMLFSTDRFQNCVKEFFGQDIHFLENFLQNLFLGMNTDASKLNFTSVRQIIDGFIERGYPLREDIPNSLISVLVRAAALKSHALVSLLIDLIDKKKLSCNSDVMQPVARPMDIVITSISKYCAVETLEIESWQLLILRPRQQKSWLLQTMGGEFKRSVMILNKLLDIGVPANEVNVNSLLNRHGCFLEKLETIQKLWWAGARVDFDVLESKLSQSQTSHCIFKTCVPLEADYKKWIEKWRKNNLTLRRLAAVKIRQIMQKQDFEALTTGILPPHKIKEIVCTPNYLLRSTD